MQSTEAGLGVPQLQSAPQISPGDENAHILYCPECAARLRLTGVSSPATAESPVRNFQARSRATLPGVSPEGDLLVPGVAEEAVSPEHATAAAAAARVGDDDEPTRIFRLSEIVAEAEQSAQAQAPVPEAPTVLASPPPAAPPPVEPVNAEATPANPDLAEDVDEVENTVAFVPSSILPSPDSHPGPVHSVSPTTHEVATTPSVRAPRSRGLLLGGLAAVSVLALGGWLFSTKSQASRDVPKGSGHVAATPLAPQVIAAADPLKPSAADTTPQAIAVSAPTSPEVAAKANEEPPAPAPAAKAISKRAAVARVAAADEGLSQAKPQAAAPTKEAAAPSGDEATPEEVPEPTGDAFDSAAAATAMNEAAARATACRQADDPSGVAVVTLSFAPSGKVTSASISGPPFMGTPTGSCIAKTMRTATVPPFKEDIKVVRKTVTIN